jgi:hypothetical protein
MPRFMLLLQEEYAPTRRGSLGGVTRAIVQAAAAMAFNLYTSAQEDNIISVLHLPMGVPLIAAFALGGRALEISGEGSGSALDNDVARLTRTHPEEPVSLST